MRSLGLGLAPAVDEVVDVGAGGEGGLEAGLCAGEGGGGVCKAEGLVGGHGFGAGDGDGG